MAIPRHLPVQGHRVHIALELLDRSHPTFVMIHGIGMSGRYFRPLAEHLNKRSNTLRIDLPGFGSSSKPTTALTLEAQAVIVGELLERLQITNAVLVGHSLGCQVALKTAIGDHRVTGLVLVGPTANRDERTIRRQLLRLLQDGVREPLAYNLTLVTDYLRCSFRCYFGTLGYMVSDQPELDLRTVACRTVLVRGANDPIAPATWTRELAGFNGDTVVREVADAPHGAHFKAARVVAELCEALL